MIKFAFKPALHLGDEPVSIEDMAADLCVDLDKIRLLIQHGWLKVVREHTIPALYLVGNPPPAAKMWLKQTLGPLPLIPFLPTRYARDLLEMKESAFRRLILDHGILVHL